MTPPDRDTLLQEARHLADGLQGDADQPGPLASLLRALVATVEAQQAEIKKLTEPDGWWDDNGEEAHEWGAFREMLDYAKESVLEVRPYHELPKQWAAEVVLSRDEDGDPDDVEVQLFATEAEARAAVTPDPDPARSRETP